MRIDSDDARALVDAYRRAGGDLWNAGLVITPLLRQAAELLGRSVRPAPFLDLGVLLGRDADDLEWRVDFLEATDGFTLSTAQLRTQTPVSGWERFDADRFTYEQLAVLLTQVEDQRELETLLEWMMREGGSGFARLDRFGFAPVIPPELRPVFAGAIAVAVERGGPSPLGGIPPWLIAGVVANADLGDDNLADLALLAFEYTDTLDDPGTPNPFELDRVDGLFGPFARQLADRPAAGRLFIDRLLDQFDETGDTWLDMHEDHTRRPMQLADIVVAAGADGPLDERVDFVDRLVQTINADRDTSGPVFWATWATHAELALEHGIITAEPTFGQHHLMPDAARPVWEHHWHEHISPFALRHTFDFVQTKKAEAQLIGTVANPAESFTDWVVDRLTPDVIEPYNDAGGTYTAREKDDFRGLRFDHSDADRGKHALIHALEDGSERGDIGQDEFAIIDHGIGAGGRPTFTVNLPGVIDLSNPVPGWDPTHFSVRDMDMAALLSATSTGVEDNLYAQMVEEALFRNGTPIGSNLLLIGHSFGADTAADLAASESFADDYNITHLVAAGYDSRPQLAHLSPDIDVLVLQNEADKAILLESSQRGAAMSFESVSINTFAHDVRVFDGGWGTDVGHHQDRYITYLRTTHDEALTVFAESLTATGYANPGSSVAIDVTLDQNLTDR